MEHLVLKLTTGEEVLGYIETPNDISEEGIFLHDVMLSRPYINNGQPLVRLVKYCIFSDGYDVFFPVFMINQNFLMNEEMVSYYSSAVQNSKVVLGNEAKQHTEKGEIGLTENEMLYVLENYTSNTAN